MTLFGNFNKGLLHGHGKEVHAAKNSTFEGFFVEGKKHGVGKLVWMAKEKVLKKEEHKDGSEEDADAKDTKSLMVVNEFYEGEFNNNKYHGNGYYYWSNGRFYRGQWANGKSVFKYLYSK